MKRIFFLALVCLLPAPPTRGQAPADRQAAIAYVKALQLPDGGFRAAAAAREPSLRATSAALRALHYLGADLPNKAACARFVQACFDRQTGGYADQPGGTPDVFTTAVGIMAAGPLDVPADDYVPATTRFLNANVKTFEDIRIAVAGLERSGARAPQAAAWLEQIDRMRNPDGTFGKGPGMARAIGGAVVASLRLGGKVDNPEAVVRHLDAGQRPDGGFGKDDVDTSDLETSYRVLRCYHMLKKQPARADALRAFVARCRNEDGGYGGLPGQPSSVGTTYFAVIILHWLEK